MTSYTIQSGDTLSKIAKKYNLNVQELIDQNGGKDTIFAGHTINLPEKGLTVEKTGQQTSAQKTDGTEAKPSQPYKTTTSYQDGTSTVKSFNAGGVETSSKEFTKDGVLAKETINRDFGKTKLEIAYSADGKSSVGKNYDEKGNLTGTNNVSIDDADPKNKDITKATVACYDKNGKLYSTSHTENDKDGHILKGTFENADGRKGSFANDYQKDGNIMETIYKEDGKTVAYKVLMDKDYNRLETTTFGDDGKIKGVKKFNEYGNVASTKQYDSDGKETTITNHVVQPGETIDKLIKQSFEKQGIKPDSQTFEKAKENFIKDNANFIKKTKSGYHYLLSGTTVKIDGDIDADKKNKNNKKDSYIDKGTKEQVIDTYDSDGTTKLQQERYLKNGSLELSENYNKSTNSYGKKTVKNSDGSYYVEESPIDGKPGYYKTKTNYDKNGNATAKFDWSESKDDWVKK